jgi:hypothetical protein
MPMQRKAEKFFYSHILHELGEQFRQFMSDPLSAQLIDNKTKKLIDDLINNMGKIKIDKLNSVRFFCENEALFYDIIDCLQDVPQSEKINAMFLSDDISKKYLIPFTLRPPGYEQMFQGQIEADPVTMSIIMEVLTRWLNFAKEREKTLPRLLDELEKIEEIEFEEYASLPEMKAEVKENIEAYKELVTILEETISKTISQPEMKPTLKRYFWEKVIVQGIELINDFCHNDQCIENNCTKIHDLAIKKTAELLKIIYPDHFDGSIENIKNEVMARYFEIRRPQTETDSFIGHLFSRYSENRHP